MTKAASTEPASLLNGAKYLLRLIKMVRLYWSGLVKSVLLGLVAGSIGMALPYLSKLYFDRVFPQRDQSLLLVLVLGVAALSCATATMNAIRGQYAALIGTRMGNDISLRFLNHLQHLPMGFYDSHRVGEVLSRFAAIRGGLSTVTQIFEIVLVQGMYLVLVPPFLLFLSWKLTLVSIVTIPVTTLVSTMMGRALRRHLKASAEANADLSAMQVEVFSQIRTLKAMAAEPLVFQQARNTFESASRAQLQTSRLSAGVGLANALVRAAGTALFTWYAWTLIISGHMTLGGFVAFSAYLAYFSGPINQFARLFTDFQQVSVTLNRAFEYFDIAPEQDPERARLASVPLVRRMTGAIRLVGVSCGYEGRRILRGVSAEFLPGSMTAVVGPSGAGKSTLIRLIGRMVDADDGEVLYDDVPSREWLLSEVRRQVAIVWQEPSLFRGTIWHNLTLGRETIDRETVDQVVQACQLHGFIRDLPEGYETPVSEWGNTLSGGQRQRFAIARAVLRDTRVVLLDEATSQVDAVTERQLLEGLRPLLAHHTVLFVTHRAAVAEVADSVLVLEDGHLSALGSPKDVLRMNGYYGAMVDSRLMSSALHEDRRMVLSL